MKKSHKSKFLNSYKWYDYTFLLQAMEDWLDNASKQTSKHGNLVRSPRTVKELKVAASLIKRIREDDIYTKKNEVFSGKNTTYDIGIMDTLGMKPFTQTNHHIVEAHRKQDIKFMFDFMAKHILTWWD